MTSLNLEAEGPINTTAHEVRQRTRCRNCGVKGNNTYQIVYTGNSDVAMDGAGVTALILGIVFKCHLPNILLHSPIRR